MESEFGGIHYTILEKDKVSQKPMMKVIQLLAELVRFGMISTYVASPILKNGQKGLKPSRGSDFHSG
jgi:hypothetical protein